MTPATQFDLALIGFEKETADLIEKIGDGLRLLKLNSLAEVEATLESTAFSPESIILVSHFCDGMTHLEAAQALVSTYEDVHVLFVTVDRALFDLKTLTKNGFQDTFLLPMDADRLEERIAKFKSSRIGGAYRKYKAIKVVDIQAGIKLPFDISTFLPMNHKYVKLTVEGVLSEKKFQILKQKTVNTVFVRTEEVGAFYEFAAQQMVNLGVSGLDAMSETERSEKFQSNVQELFRSFLDVTESTDLESGRDLLEQSKKVIESFVLKKTGMDLNRSFATVTGVRGSTYSHAQSVSTIASLLSMGTGIGQPTDLAIAGLFHDIGLVGTRDNLSVFDLPSLVGEDREAFLNHPKLSLKILREKRLILAPIIVDILEKHHERVDGSGFPAQLRGTKIPPDAQLLSYADAFEHLSRPKAGVASLSPIEIHARIAAEVGISPDVLQRIQNFLQKSAAESAAS